MPKSSRTRPAKRRSSQEEALPQKQLRGEQSDAASPLDFHSPDTLFQSLIQPLGAEKFFQDYWEKKPLHLQRSDPRTSSYYQSLFQLSDLQALCALGLEFYRDVNLVRCVNGKKKVLNKDGPVKSGVLNKMFHGNKATVQFHQPQRFKDELWRIQEKLESFFGALVGSNVYITPAESQGLPAHYDDVEVFILQLEGQKQWLLHQPTVPLAAEYSVESQDRIGPPTHQILLKAGDLLYFPRGTIHQASTPAGQQHSTHLTLSTYQRMSWGDLLLDTLPSMLYDSSRTDVGLREGMPRKLLLGGGDDADSSRRLVSSLRSLADGLERGALEIRSSHMKRDFILNRLPPYNQQVATSSEKIPGLEDQVCLRYKDHVMITVESSQEKTDEASELVVFVFHSLKNNRRSHMMGGGDEEEEEEDVVSKGLKFPLSHLPALRQLHQSEQLLVSELQLPTQEAKVGLVLALWSESLLDLL